MNRHQHLIIFMVSLIIHGHHQVSSSFNLLSGLSPNFEPARENREPEPPTSSDPWPSAVRIIDVADLPGLLFNRPNHSSSSVEPSSASVWSSIFNIFNSNDDPDYTMEDEMDRENVAWFAIPGWNEAMNNGSGLDHHIYPGVLVPAKFAAGDINATRIPYFDPMFHNVTGMVPLGFLFNHGSDDQHLDLLHPGDHPANHPGNHGSNSNKIDHHKTTSSMNAEIVTLPAEETIKSTQSTSTTTTESPFDDDDEDEEDGRVRRSVNMPEGMVDITDNFVQNAVNHSMGEVIPLAAKLVEEVPKKLMASVINMDNEGSSRGSIMVPSEEKNADSNEYDSNEIVKEGERSSDSLLSKLASLFVGGGSSSDQSLGQLRPSKPINPINEFGNSLESLDGLKNAAKAEIESFTENEPKLELKNDIDVHPITLPSKYKTLPSNIDEMKMIGGNKRFGLSRRRAVVRASSTRTNLQDTLSKGSKSEHSGKSTRTLGLLGLGALGSMLAPAFGGGRQGMDASQMNGAGINRYNTGSNFGGGFGGSSVGMQDNRLGFNGFRSSEEGSDTQDGGAKAVSEEMDKTMKLFLNPVPVQPQSIKKLEPYDDDDDDDKPEIKSNSGSDLKPSVIFADDEAKDVSRKLEKIAKKMEDVTMAEFHEFERESETTTSKNEEEEVHCDETKKIKNPNVPTYLNFIRDMDKAGCTAKLVCELGADPYHYGQYGMQLCQFFMQIDPKDYNSPNVDFYFNMHEMGKKEGLAFCGENSKCDQDLNELVKAFM